MKRFFEKFLTLACLAGAGLAPAAQAYEAGKLVDIHGFLAQGFVWTDRQSYPMSDTKGGTTQFSEAGLTFTTTQVEKLRVGAQLFTRQFGDDSDNGINLDWAVGDYRWRDWLGFRAGRLKRPKGLYNETRDIDQLHPMILLPSALYHQVTRADEISLDGFSIYGKVPAGSAGSLNYQLLRGSHRLGTNGGILEDTRDSGLTSEVEGTLEPLYVGSLIWNTPLRGLLMGTTASRATLHVDGTSGPNGASLGGPEGTPFSSSGRLDTYTASIEYTQEKFSLVSEALRSPSRFSFGDEAIQRSFGWYMGGSWRPVDLLEFGAYYSEFYPDEKAKTGATVSANDPPYKAWTKDTALFCKVNVNEALALKVEGHYLNGTAALDDGVNTNPPQHSLLFATKVSYSF